VHKRAPTRQRLLPGQGDTQRLVRAATAGAITSPICNLGELVFIHQDKLNQAGQKATLPTALKSLTTNYGYRSLLRGTLLTAIREPGHTAAWVAGAPILCQRLDGTIDNTFARVVVTGCATGTLAAAAITHC